MPDTEPADPVAQDLFGEEAEDRTEEDPDRPWLAPENGNGGGSSNEPIENHLRKRKVRKARRDDNFSEPDERNILPETQRGSGENYTLAVHWPAMTNPQLREFCDMYAPGGTRKGFTGNWEEDTGEWLMSL